MTMQRLESDDMAWSSSSATKDNMALGCASLLPKKKKQEESQRFPATPLCFRVVESQGSPLEVRVRREAKVAEFKQEVAAAFRCRTDFQLSQGSVLNDDAFVAALEDQDILLSPVFAPNADDSKRRKTTENDDVVSRRSDASSSSRFVSSQEDSEEAESDSEEEEESDSEEEEEDGAEEDSAMEEYPMSEYSDADEPLFEKPVIPLHKRKCIPNWANDSELKSALLRQEKIDADSDIFCVEADESLPKCNLLAIFGYEPPPSCARRRNQRKRPLYSPSPKKANSQENSLNKKFLLPSLSDDVEMSVVAACDLPKKDGSLLSRGFVYVAVMRDDDYLTNLRRHYAKHNGLTETDIALTNDQGSILDLKSNPRLLNLSNRLGKATVYAQILSSTINKEPERKVSRRISEE